MFAWITALYHLACNPFGTLDIYDLLPMITLFTWEISMLVTFRGTNVFIIIRASIHCPFVVRCRVVALYSQHTPP